MAITKLLTILCISMFGLVGIFLVFSKRKKSMANKILGIFFLLWSLNFLDGYLLLNGFYLKFPSLGLWEEPLVFLYGPLIYFYSSALTSRKPAWRPIYLLHFIPVIVFCAITSWFYHLLPVERKLEILDQVLSLEQPPEVFSLILLVFFHIFLYLWASWRLLKKYTKEIENNYSTINLSWLKNTLKSLVFILLFSMVVSVIQFLGNALLFNIGLLVLMIALTVFITGVLFQAFEEPQLFVNQSSDSKYSASKLTISQKLDIENRIKQILDQDKIYLNPDTTITDLADALDLPARQVSQVINQQFNQTFFELINSYRIKEAQTIIKSSGDPKLTILEVMYKVGFNSKSSFNTQFKRIAGITPSEYKRLHQ